MGNRTSLKKVLMFHFVLFLLVPIFIINFFTFRVLTKHWEEEIAGRNYLLAQTLAGEVEEFLSEPINILAQIQAVISEGGLVNDRYLDDYLSLILKNYQFFDMIQILDKRGEVQYVAPFNRDYLGTTVMGQDFFKATLAAGQPYWSQTFISTHSGQPTLTVSMFIGQGVIVGYLNLGKLTNIIDRVKFGPNSFSGIADQAGTYIAHTNKENVSQRVSIRKQEFNGNRRTYRYNDQGRDMLASTAMIERTGWSVMVSQPYSEVFAPVNQARTIFLAGTVFAWLAAILIALLTLNKVLRPVSELAQKAKEIAGGNYDSNLQANTYQEFSGLAQDFVTMSEAVKEREKEIKSSLQEKDVLLREVHHRVKNNMQVISSLIRLQAGHSQDRIQKELLEESQHRIRSMFLVHEKLYQSPDLAKIDFRDYVHSLVNGLYRSYGADPEKISLKVDVADIRLGLDNAIPCGLIVNELVSNAFKYAFPQYANLFEKGGHDQCGEIKVILRSVSEGKIELIVSDNGIGLPEGLDFKNTESLGLQLVTTLAEDELAGEIEVNRAEGLEYIIRFGGVS